MPPDFKKIVVMQHTSPKIFTHAGFFLLALLVFVMLPDLSYAGGIESFTSPFESIVNTLTGTWGRLISIIVLAASGIFYIFSKDDLSGGVKIMVQIVFGISFICFSAGIVDKIFTFSKGAII